MVFCDSSERAAVVVSKPLSQNIEITVCSPLSSPGFFNSVSVGAAKNPAASRDVHLVAFVPALTSGASTSLSFVLLTPPAAPDSEHAPELPVSVLFMQAQERQFSDWSRAHPSSRFQSSSSELSGASVFSQVAWAPELPVSVQFQ